MMRTHLDNTELAHLDLQNQKNLERIQRLAEITEDIKAEGAP